MNVGQQTVAAWLEAVGRVMTSRSSAAASVRLPAAVAMSCTMQRYCTSSALCVKLHNAILLWHHKCSQFFVLLNLARW